MLERPWTRGPAGRMLLRRSAATQLATAPRPLVLRSHCGVMVIDPGVIYARNEEPRPVRRQRERRRKRGALPFELT